MKTLKKLKTTFILNGIFCFCCIASTICLAINHYCNIYIFFGIGVLLAYGWMVNPFAIISCFRCFAAYLSERKMPECKQLIGRKWVWIIIWPIITTILYLLSAGLFIAFTGGV